MAMVAFVGEAAIIVLQRKIWPAHARERARNERLNEEQVLMFWVEWLSLSVVVIVTFVLSSWMSSSPRRGR
jgi:hypothetical protein